MISFHGTMRSSNIRWRCHPFRHTGGIWVPIRLCLFVQYPDTGLDCRLRQKYRPNSRGQFDEVQRSCVHYVSIMLILLKVLNGNLIALSTRLRSLTDNISIDQHRVKKHECVGLLVFFMTIVLTMFFDVGSKHWVASSNINSHSSILLLCLLAVP